MRCCPSQNARRRPVPAARQYRRPDARSRSAARAAPARRPTGRRGRSAWRRTSSWRPHRPSCPNPARLPRPCSPLRAGPPAPRACSGAPRPRSARSPDPWTRPRAAWRVDEPRPVRCGRAGCRGRAGAGRRRCSGPARCRRRRARETTVVVAVEVGRWPVGIAAVRRLVPRQPAAACRNADRPADIGPGRQRGQPSRQCSRRPARGTSRAKVEVEGVAGHAPEVGIADR